MSATTPKKIKVTILIDGETIERIDRLSAWLASRVPGLKVRRSFGTRAAIFAGLDAYESSVRSLAEAREKSSRRR